MKDEKSPHPLDYERQSPFSWRSFVAFTWWNLIALLGLLAYLAGMIACWVYADPESLGEDIILCTIAFVAVLMVWAGVKYGVQKRDFWA